MPALSESSLQLGEPSLSSSAGHTQRPRILLLGPRRSGKTSIQRVVFQKMSPHETLFRLEGTSFMETHEIDNNHLVQFDILDFPGDFALGDGGDSLYQSTVSIGDEDNDDDYEEGHNPTEAELLEIYRTSSSIIFVIDAQDEPYDSVLQGITVTIKDALACNSRMKFEVFINKVDGELFLSDEAK